MSNFDCRSRSLSTTGAAALATGSMLLAGAGAGVLGAALLAAPVGAAVFTVTNTNDSGEGSLRAAITQANSNPGLDTISFSDGAIGTIRLDSDLPAITEGVTISGPGSGALTISGNRYFHAFTVATEGSGAVTISGLTITQSITRTGSGGAIEVHDTALTLDDMVLVDNAAVFDVSTVAGGAVFVENNAPDMDVTISNSIISGNEARSILIEPVSDVAPAAASGYSLGGGAAIAAENVAITNVTISENDSISGAGLVVESFGSFTLQDSTITSNHATQQAGGLRVQAQGSISIISSDIVSNTAGYVVGGGLIYNNSESGPVLISDTRISDNVSGEVGGFAVIQPVGKLLIERTSITGNIGANIGGLTAFYGGTIASSTIANNVGAGVALGSPYETGPASVGVSNRSHAVDVCSIEPEARLINDIPVTITNSTVTGNTREGIGANIRLDFSYETAPTTSTQMSRALRLSSSDCESSPAQTVSIGLVHVLAADNGLEDVASPAISLFSLIERPNAGVFPGYGTQLGIDPRLQPLEFVNRTVSVVPIHANSPAWDAGYPGFVPPPATDQRGLPRVVQIIDIGAYEVQEMVVQPKFTG